MNRIMVVVRTALCAHLSALILLLSGPLLLPERLAGQEQAKPRRARIGLALGGGSALGIAHIGVLRWLEEHRIPVDYVGGTSMGGLIGGMYATGNSAEEIHQIINGADWEKVFAIAAQYQDLSFRRKEDRVSVSNELEFGLRHGFRFSSGLGAGQEVSLLLSRFAAPYSSLRSFDELPTPFRCVATDLVQENQVVFGDGSLTEALRATISLPGIFAPVRRGEQVLVDGGVLNNLPADVVKKMGADVVIAVMFESPKVKAGALTSVGDILGRTVSVGVDDNQMRNVKYADLMLIPEVQEFGPLAFTSALALEQRGYDAAARKARFLETLSVSESEWKEYQAARRSRQKPRTAPQSLTIVGAGDRTRKIEKDFRSLLGKPPEVPDLEERLNRVTGRGRFATAGYSLTRQNGEDGLTILLARKDYAPPLLNLAMTIDGARMNEMRFDLAARVTFPDFGGPSSDLRLDVGLGIQNHLDGEYYWRIAGSRWFLAPRLFYTNEKQDLYSGHSRVAVSGVTAAGGGMDLGIAAGDANEFRFGYELNRTRYTVDIGSPLLPNFHGNFSFWRARWAFDSTDHPAIPESGVRATTEFRWMLTAPGVNRSFPFLESRILAARELTPKYLLLARAAGGTTFFQDTPYSTFTLGGPFDLSALGRNELRGDSYYYGSVSVLRVLAKNPISLFRRTYLAVGYELGDAFQDLKKTNPLQDGTLGIVGVSSFGEFYLGGSYGERGERKILFRFGRLF